jgi:hypothetical protein
VKTKFSGRRPVMFYQEALNDNYSYQHSSRVRIFYPDGRSEWCAFAFAGDGLSKDFYNFDEVPCWEKETKKDEKYHKIAPSKTMMEAIRRARKFDKECGFPKMEMVCEL